MTVAVKIELSIQEPEGITPSVRTAIRARADGEDGDGIPAMEKRVYPMQVAQESGSSGAIPRGFGVFRISDEQYVSPQIHADHIGDGSVG
jgi:hypothetical protein